MEGKLRVLAYVAVLGSMALHGQLAVAEHPFSTDVYPTGVYPDDVSNVQAAVSAGGNVVLQATDLSGTPTAFNFGPATEGSGAVGLLVDVNISGTRAATGEMTTITGGAVPIQVVRPIHFAVRGLRFVGPLDGAIDVVYSRDAVIAGNVVQDVVPFLMSDGTTQGIAIGVNSGTGPTSNIRGNVLIADNVIDGVLADAGYGIVSAHHDAEATIEGNKVSRINLNGILAGYISAHAFILNNLVVPGPAANPGFSAGNGIFVGHARGGHFSIYNNRVICANPLADGIAVIASATAPVDGSSIVGNDVTMLAGQYGGISIYDSPAHVRVLGNTIRGESAYALQIGVAVSATPSAVANTIEANDVSDHVSTTTDIFLDVNAANTLLCNQVGSLVDNGTGTQTETNCTSSKTR